jgi:hypothetical protein
LCVRDRASVAGVIVAAMDAAAWTAIGLLATFSLGSLFHLGSRIDALSARMDGRFDALIARMDARFDAVDARLDAVNARIDAHLDRHAG